MRKGIILAACCLLAAALAGCEFQAAIPAFLLPSGSGAATETPSASPSAAATTPAATATPVPTATPKPSPTASPEPYTVVTRYESELPKDLTVSLAYSTYATPLNYFVAMRGGSVYAKPDAKSSKQKNFGFGNRFQLDKLVLGADGKSRWYHVLWADKKGKHEGYIKESAGKARSFRISNMLDRAKLLKQATDTPNTVYIVNYKDRKGMAPMLPGGKEEDAWGTRRSMSAPAYTESNTKSAFRYAPDGLLGTKLETANNMTKVWFPSFGEARWVPNKYISKDSDAISSLNTVAIVDRLNQNTATFTNVNGVWTLISMSYVSTGKTGGYAVKTPLGDFMAQERVSKFYYYADGTKKIAGYAPYAIRFSGGGYLHGVPRDFKHSASGKRIDPGIAEALYTLGTTPQSHMCVRNYSSYAKFLYDRFVKGQWAVIVFE